MAVPSGSARAAPVEVGMRRRASLIGTDALTLALTLALSLLAAGSAGGLAAQGTALDRGTAALRGGEYGDAVRQLTDAIGSATGADRIRAIRGLARARLETGAYADGLAELDRFAASGVAAMETARERAALLRATGRHDEALAALDRAIGAGTSQSIGARYDRAVLLWDRGERDRAFAAFDAFIDLYNGGDARTAAELAAVAGAVTYLGLRRHELFHDAVRAYEEALAADPGLVAPRVAMGRLFLEKYRGSDAQALFNEALSLNPRHPDALLAMARAKRFEGSSEAGERVDAALATNPRHAEALAFRGLLRLELGDHDGAVESAEAALAVDERTVDALAVRAAARYLRGEMDGYRADERRALAIDATGGGFHGTVAEMLVRHARYREAVELATRAVALDPLDWETRSLLGMNQLRLGQIETGRATLEAAFEGDPFNAWSKNSLDLLDELATFETRTTDRFQLVMDPGEADLLLPYIEDVAEQAYEQLSATYGYEPEVPVRVEVFPSHADFSVRTMGLAGLGALGVAFGNVLAMDSPAARDPGEFHWASTLWHEIAHAVTLGRTGNRVARWLTEGISVREERRSRPGWGGHPGPDFFMAYGEGMLLPLERIDEGFVRPSYPGQIGISYQHASLIVELIETEHGQDAIIELLDAYADGQGTARAIRAATGRSPDQIDQALERFVESRYGHAVRAVEGLTPEHLGLAPPDPARRTTGGLAGGDPVREARLDPNDFALQLAAGSALFRQDRHDDAVPFLERAIELYPEYAAPGSPYEMLAAIRKARGDRAGAAELLRRLTARNESAYAANLELASLLEALGDHAGAAGALDRAMYIYPYDADAHGRLADLAERLGRHALEVRERRAIVALRPVDRAGAYYRLALAQRRAGDLAGARRSVLSALEAAPNFAEAQDLLLELSGS